MRGEHHIHGGGFHLSLLSKGSGCQYNFARREQQRCAVVVVVVVVEEEEGGKYSYGLR